MGLFSLTRRAAVFSVAGALLLGASLAVTAAPALAAPAPTDFSNVPSRTAISYIYLPTGARTGTANENESRPGLSIVKLYLADYALRHGDGSQSDLNLTQRMIQLSDNNSASSIDRKYPGAINKEVAEFGLKNTYGASFWGNSSTSTADVLNFLVAKRAQDLGSPIFGWMATAAPIADDGTAQNWGTSHLPGAIGTKWGWADDVSSDVASATYGADFIAVANTYAPPQTQTNDVLAAFNGIIPVPAPPAPVAPSVTPGPQTIADLLRSLNNPILTELANAIPQDLVVPGQ